MLYLRDMALGNAELLGKLRLGYLVLIAKTRKGMANGFTLGKAKGFPPELALLLDGINGADLFLVRLPRSASIIYLNYLADRIHNLKTRPFG